MLQHLEYEEKEWLGSEFLKKNIVNFLLKFSKIKMEPALLENYNILHNVDDVQALPKQSSWTHCLLDDGR